MVDPIAPASVPGTAVPPPAGRPVVLPDGWTVTVTDKIIGTVDSVRSKTTTPITLVARGLVYGLVVTTAGIAALVLLLALALRGLVLLVGLIPVLGDEPGRPVWIVDLVIGLGLLALGTRIMAKARTPRRDPEA